ncbi:arginine--tRNA ligase [Patescibacteria group bacterium]
MKDYLEQKVIESVKNAFDIALEIVLIEHPDNKIHGDFSTNVALTLTKKLNQSPMDIAKKLCYELHSFDMEFEFLEDKYPIFESIECSSPGFINFKLSDNWLKNLPYQVSNNPTSYGSSDTGDQKIVLIEYSQPNPNKPLHIGHSRNNFLGSSLANIFEFLNYDVVKANYMNDWGTHICKSMLMYKMHFENQKPDRKPDHFVGMLYVKYTQEEEKDPELKEKVTELFRSLEAGEEETIDLWKKITGWVYEGWKETYANEGAEFDVWFYQSDYKESGKKVVQKAINDGIAEKDETGAVIARLEKLGLPDKVLLRSDGTSVYATQDIDMARDGFEKYKFDKRLYVVDYRQSDYFKQLFEIAKALGYEWADRLHHVSYGTVSLPEGEMSSRKGLVMDADEVFEKLTKLEEEEVESDLPDVGEIIRKVAIGAYRYGMLRVDPKQNVVFDYNLATKFEGNTGPYLMYTYARAKSVLEKAGFTQEMFNDYSPIDVPLEEREKDVLRIMYQFQEVVEEAGERFAPNLIANFTFELAQSFNSFYASVPVLGTEDEDQKMFRLHLVWASAQVLQNALGLLGIRTVDKM